MLEGAKDRNDFGSAAQIQRDVADRRTIQAPLTIEGFPHRFAPRRFGRAGTGFPENCRFRQNRGSFFEELFAQIAANSSSKRILQRTLTNPFFESKHYAKAA